MKGEKPVFIAPKDGDHTPWELPPDAEGTNGWAPAHTHKGPNANAITNWGKKNN